MLIGELSRRTGFSRDTIRWYERIGLIMPDQSRGENNYRRYSHDIVDRLIFIKKIKTFGFTLKEINEILFIDETIESDDCPVSEILQFRLDKIEEKISELQNKKSKLIHAWEMCKGDCREILETESGL